MNPNITLIDRYIITNLIPLFGFGLGLFSSLALAIGVLFEYIQRIANQGLPLLTALKLLFLKLPEFIVLATPMAILLATVLTYAKLSRHNEIIALLSFGISPRRIIIPGICFSLLVAIVTFYFNDCVVPVTNHSAAITLENFFNIDRAKLKSQEIIYQDYQTTRESETPDLKYIFYAQRMENQTLKKAMVIQFQERALDQITWTELAHWNEKTNHWDLQKGALYNSKNREIKTFQTTALSLSRKPYDFANHFLDNREMNLAQSYERLSLIEPTENTKLIKELKISIQEKYALPFSSLVFGLIGAALSIHPTRDKQRNRYGLILLIILLFFILRFVAISLSMTEIVPIWLGVWFPNILGLMVFFSWMRSHYNWIQS